MYQPKFPEFWVRWKAVLDSREITSLSEIKKVIYISTWHVILIIADHKTHAHHNTHLQTMKVYNTRPVSLLLIKILFFFFDHGSVHLFQSNQRFQAIKLVDRPAPEKL